MKTHYEVLGIHKTADERAIKMAYRRAALANHPDHFGNTEANGAEIKAEKEKLIKEINIAYEVLGDPAKRARYDKFELPNIERQQREGSAPEGAKEETKFYAEVPKTEEKKKEEAKKEENTGGFEYDEEEAQEQQKWKAKAPKKFGGDEADEQEDKEKERQRADAERWAKDGEHKVKDDDKTIGSYNKKGDKLTATLGDDEGVNKKMLDQMIDHALKVSKPPLKISGGGEFMRQAMQACKERGIECKNGNIPSFGRRG